MRGLQTWGVIPRLFPSTQLPSVASPPPRLNSPPLPPLGPHLDFSSIAATVQHQHHRLPTPQVSSLPSVSVPHLGWFPDSIITMFLVDLGAADGSIFLPTLPRASAPRLCPHSIPQSILTAARFSSTLTNADPIPGAYTHGMAR